jgi:Tol biopolymer transport system component
MERSANSSRVTLTPTGFRIRRPMGRWAVYIAYLEDQGEAHPFGKQVKLRLMDLRDRSVRDLTPEFFGGQGTINVPSWSPDSKRVAFVVYSKL